MATADLRININGKGAWRYFIPKNIYVLGNIFLTNNPYSEDDKSDKLDIRMSYGTIRVPNDDTTFIDNDTVAEIYVPIEGTGNLLGYERQKLQEVATLNNVLRVGSTYDRRNGYWRKIELSLFDDTYVNDNYIRSSDFKYRGKRSAGIDYNPLSLLFNVFNNHRSANDDTNRITKNLITLIRLGTTNENTRVQLSLQYPSCVEGVYASEHSGITPTKGRKDTKVLIDKIKTKVDAETADELKLMLAAEGIYSKRVDKVTASLSKTVDKLRKEGKFDKGWVNSRYWNVTYFGLNADGLLDILPNPETIEIDGSYGIKLNYVASSDLTYLGYISQSPRGEFTHCELLTNDVDVLGSAFNSDVLKVIEFNTNESKPETLIGGIKLVIADGVHAKIVQCKEPLPEIRKGVAMFDTSKYILDNVIDDLKTSVRNTLSNGFDDLSDFEE